MDSFIQPIDLLARILPTLASILSFAIAAVVLMASSERRLARSFGAFAVVLGLWSFSVALKTSPEILLTHRLLAELMTFPLLFLPAISFDVALLLAKATDPVSRIGSRAAWCGTVVFVLLQTQGLVFDGFNEYPGGAFAAAGPALPGFIVFVTVTVFGGVLACWLALRDHRDKSGHQEARYWLIAVAMFAPASSVNFLVSYGLPLIPAASVGHIFLLFVFIHGAYRSRLLGIEPLVLRTITALAVGSCILVPFVLGILRLSGLGLDFVALALLSVSFLGIIRFVRRSGQAKALLEAVGERILFPHRQAARRCLSSLSSNLAQFARENSLANRLTEGLVECFGATGAALYLATDNDGFRLEAVVGEFPASDQIRHLLTVDDFTYPEVRWATVAVPFPSTSVRRGFIAVGSKSSGAVFDDVDLSLLTMITAHVSLAVDSAEMAQRLRVEGAELATLRKRDADAIAAVRAEARINPRFVKIIGENDVLLSVLSRVESAARSELPILVLGETGTGKELVARAVHDLSDRHAGPFISLNCPAIPVDLAESELFGHERGAFTGAHEARPGRFEAAHGGTIFLDEVADLPMPIQTKLLRVIQELETQRLGSQTIQKLDFRVVAATNRDLRAEVANGRFREDLFHRLIGMHVTVPPLRCRRDDIPLLANHFLDRATATLNKDVTGLTEDALDALLHYRFPGNIRELQHLIDRAVLLCPGQLVRAEDLGDLPADTLPAETAELEGSLTNALRDEKIRRVEDALVRTGGNQAAAARILCMSRSNLSRMMKRYGIKARRLVLPKDDTDTALEGALS